MLVYQTQTQSLTAVNYMDVKTKDVKTVATNAVKSHDEVTFSAEQEQAGETSGN